MNDREVACKRLSQKPIQYSRFSAATSERLVAAFNFSIEIQASNRGSGDVANAEKPSQWTNHSRCTA